MRSEFNEILKELREVGPRVSDALFSKVLQRVAVASPDALPRADLADGRNLPRQVEELSDGSVSRAVAALIKKEMLEELDPVSERPGRPLKPLRLPSAAWTSIGVYVQTRHGHPTSLTGVLTGLDGQELVAACLRPEKHALDDIEAFVPAAAQLVNELKDAARGGGSRVLGVALSLGGHVNAGTVIDSTPTRWESLELANRLEKEVKLAVVVENDVNALAVGETYSRSYPEADMAVVGVFDEGVGGALIVGGEVFRGGFGMAGEIGHLTVEYQRDDLDEDDAAAARRRGAVGKRSFAAPCPPPCSQYGHVDCIAPPARIRSELRSLKAKSFKASAAMPSDLSSKPVTDAEKAFARAGRALGRALVSVIDVANPSRIIVYLPEALAVASPGTVAARYRAAMEEAASAAFSTGALNARAGGRTFTVKHFPSVMAELESSPEIDSFENTSYVMAKETAWCVLDAFIKHAAGERRPEAPEPGGPTLGVVG